MCSGMQVSYPVTHTIFPILPLRKNLYQNVYDFVGQRPIYTPLGRNRKALLRGGDRRFCSRENNQRKGVLIESISL